MSRFRRELLPPAKGSTVANLTNSRDLVEEAQQRTCERYAGMLKKMAANGRK